PDVEVNQQLAIGRKVFQRLEFIVRGYVVRLMQERWNANQAIAVLDRVGRWSRSGIESDCARISVYGIDLRGRGSERDVGRVGRIDGNGQDPLPLPVRNAVDEPSRDLNLVSGGRRNGERILCTVENSLNAVNENVAGHDAEVAIGGTGGRRNLNQIELLVWPHVAVGDDVFGDAAQDV